MKAKHIYNKSTGVMANLIADMELSAAAETLDPLSGLIPRTRALIERIEQKYKTEANTKTASAF